MGHQPSTTDARSASSPAAERKRIILKEWYDWEKTLLKVEYEVFEDDPHTWDGVRKYYYKSGRLRAERLYRQDLLCEVLRCVDGEGNPLDHGTLAAGEGTLKNYYENGAVQDEGVYVGGRPHGLWTYYHADGSANGGGEYRHGEKVGEWKWINQQGVVFRRYLYGEEGIRRFDYKDGRLISEETATMVRGHYVRHGLRKEFDEKGNVTRRISYDLGGVLKEEAVDTNPLLRAYNARLQQGANAAALAKALTEATFGPYKYVYKHNAKVFVPALTKAVADGAVKLTAELAAEIFVAMASLVRELLPLLELIEGNPSEAFEARLDQLARAERVEKMQVIALLLALWQVRTEDWTLDQRFDKIIKNPLSHMEYDSERIFSHLLRPLIASLPEERREELVLTFREYNQTYIPSWQFVGTCPTPKAIDACLAQLLTWERSQFTYCEYRYTNTVEAFDAFGEAAAPAIIASLAGEGGKCAQREILVRALANARCPEAAPTLLECLNDGIEPVRQAAVDGLVVLGAAALPHLEEGLRSRKKKVRIGAAQALAGMPTTPEVREIIERHLPSVKEAESVQALQGALGPRQELPAGIVALDALRASYTAEDRDALYERLARVDSLYSLMVNLAILDPRTIVIAADDHLKWRRGEGNEGWGEKWREPPFNDCGFRAMAQVRANPAMAWLAAEILMAFPKNKWAIQRALEEATEGFGKRLAAPLAYHLNRATTEARPFLIDWLAEHAPWEGREALLGALGDSTKGTREAAIRALTGVGAAILPELWPLLEGPAAQVTSVATILRDVPSQASIPHLEAALAREKNAGRQELMEAAINAARLAGPVDADASTDDDEGYEELDRSLASRKVGKVPAFEATPALRWLDGTAVSQGATQWIMAALGAEGPEGPNAELVAIGERLQDEGCHALARDLAADPGWGQRWVIYAASLLGDDLLMDRLGAALQNLVHAVSAHHAAHGINALVRNPTPSAVRWLDHWSRKAQTRKLKKDARQGLAELMEREGLSQDDLVDQATPTLGFSSRGELAFDYAGRSLTLVLDGQNDVRVRDETGKVTKSLPRARKDQAPAAVDAARERFKAIKKSVGGTTKDVLVRLEDAMIIGRRWPATRWKAFFLDNPVLYGLARGLVFAIHADSLPTSPIVDLFFVSEEGEILGADLEPVELATEATISIPHVVSLGAEQRQTWSALLSEAEILQPFPQIEREFVADAQKALQPEKGLEVPTLLVARSLRRLGYKAGRPEDAGNVFEAKRQIGSRLELVLSHTGYYVQTSAIGAEDKLEIYGISPSWLAGAQAGPIPESVYSEAARDLQAFLALES